MRLLILQSMPGSPRKGRPLVAVRVVASFKEFRAGLEPGIGCSPKGGYLHNRTRGGGP